MTDAEAAQLTRNLETRSLECGAMTTHLMCSGCDGAATQGWGPCLHDCHQGPEPDDAEFDADLRAINERLVEAVAETSPPVPSTALNRHLAEMGAPLLAPGQSITGEQLAALNNRHRPVSWCVCPPCQERRARPWWRRMFGGAR